MNDQCAGYLCAKSIKMTKIIFQNLGKLEIFTLFQNNISKVENLGCQQNLEIFSIGNNVIEDESCVSWYKTSPLVGYTIIWLSYIYYTIDDGWGI